jgi:hypothetical protein
VDGLFDGKPAAKTNKEFRNVIGWEDPSQLAKGACVVTEREMNSAPTVSVALT